METDESTPPPTTLNPAGEELSTLAKALEEIDLNTPDKEQEQETPQEMTASSTSETVGSGDAPAPPTTDSDDPPSPTTSTLLIPHPTTPIEILSHIYTYYFHYGSCLMDLSIFDIKRMEIISVTPMHTYRYVLDTFLETRTFFQSLEPYSSKENDTNHDNKTPLPNRWTIPVHPPKMYADNASTTVDLPDYGEIVPCTNCIAGGMICGVCDGMGFKKCTWCHGSHAVLVIGKPGPEPCTFCMRKEGREPCPSCQSGQVTCGQCNGSSKLVRKLTLNVNWTTETRILDLEREEVKENLIKYEHWAKVVMESECLAHTPIPLPFEEEPIFTETAKKEMEDWIERQKDNPYSRILTFYQRIGVIPVVKVVFKLDGAAEDWFFLFSPTLKPYFPHGCPIGSRIKGFMRGFTSVQ